MGVHQNFAGSKPGKSPARTPASQNAKLSNLPIGSAHGLLWMESRDLASVTFWLWWQCVWVNSRDSFSWASDRTHEASFFLRWTHSVRMNLCSSCTLSPSSPQGSPSTARARTGLGSSWAVATEGDINDLRSSDPNGDRRRMSEFTSGLGAGGKMLARSSLATSCCRKASWLWRLSAAGVRPVVREPPLLFFVFFCNTSPKPQLQCSQEASPIYIESPTSPSQGSAGRQAGVTAAAGRCKVVNYATKWTSQKWSPHTPCPGAVADNLGVLSGRVPVLSGYPITRGKHWYIGRETRGSGGGEGGW